jgi:hypothetical protein
MKWETIGKILGGFVGAAIALSIACCLLLSQPTGHYYMNNGAGAFSNASNAACTIYEDVRFGPDRLMYAGDADRAFQFYKYLTSQPVPREQPGKYQLTK